MLSWKLLDQQGDLSQGSKIMIVMVTIGVMGLSLFVFSGCLIIKVFRLVKLKDAPLLLSVVAIFLSLACNSAS